MIIIAGTFDVDPDHRDEFVAAKVDQLIATWDEPGCLDYVMTADPTKPNLVRLFERWEDDAALAKHFEVIAARRAEGTPDPTAPWIRGIDLNKYEIASFGPMG